jgi:DNA polymerase-3 subunit delta
MANKDEVLKLWKKQDFQPLYWFHGEEDYEIDLLVQHAEEHILTDEEKAFNLFVFYGRDAQWQEVLNACRMHPMAGARQLVILKEAQMMKDIEQLEGYFLHPLNTTVFIVAYKSKPFDKRKSFSKVIAKRAVVVETVKLREDKLAPWVIDYFENKGFTITPKCAALLVEQIGNSVSRISNEIDKLLLNIKDTKNITEEHIESFIGISKEYNVFELQNAVTKRDLPKALAILQYFEANPKSASIHSVIPLLYSEFSKLYVAHGLKDKSVESLKTVYFNAYFAMEARNTLKMYNAVEVEKVILLLHQYNLKSLGVGVSSSISQPELLKELIAKIILC